MYDDKPGLRNDALVTISEVHLLRHDFDSAKDQFEKCLSLKNDRDMIIVLVPGDFDHSVTGEKSQKVTRENDQKSHLTPLIIQFPEDCQKQFLPFL